MEKLSKINFLTTSGAEIRFSVMFLGILMFLGVGATQLPENFVKTIHHLETSGRFGAIWGDNFRSLGPFQISYGCWLDAGVPGTYNNCADYDYSVKVLNAYCNKYGRELIEAGRFEEIARIWNGGPLGHKKRSTKQYGRKFSVEFNKKFKGNK